MEKKKQVTGEQIHCDPISVKRNCLSVTHISIHGGGNADKYRPNS